MSSQSQANLNAKQTAELKAISNQNNSHINNGSKLDTVNTNLGVLTTSISNFNTSNSNLLNGIDSALGHIEDDTDGLNTLLTSTNTKIDSSNGLLALISTNTSNTKSSVDTVNSNLTDIETEVAKTQVITHNTSVASISANSAGPTYDLGVNSYRVGKLKISADMIAANPYNLYIQISSDNTNWSWVSGVAFVSTNGGGVFTNFFNMTIDNPMRYWRFYNNDSVAVTGIIDNLWYRVNQM